MTLKIFLVFLFIWFGLPRIRRPFGCYWKASSKIWSYFVLDTCLFISWYWTMRSEGLDTCNFSQILKFSCLWSLVQPKSALIYLFYAASNFFVYLLLKILTSETYISAVCDVMLYRCNFVFVKFYILLTVHHVTILGKWPTWCTNYFLCIYFYL